MALRCRKSLTCRQTSSRKAADDGANQTVSDEYVAAFIEGGNSSKRSVTKFNGDVISYHRRPGQGDSREARQHAALEYLGDHRWLHT